MATSIMSFLGMQDLATVAAQADLCRMFIGWCVDSDLLLGLVEGGVVGGLLGSLLRSKA